MNHFQITWSDVRQFCCSMQPGKVYGVPRGGAILAGIAEMMNPLANRQVVVVKDPQDADYIVDDVIDSGRTWKAHSKFKKQFVAMVDKTSQDFKSEWVVFPWENPNPLCDNEDTVVRMLELIGEDPNREGLKDTPRRYLKALAEMTDGYQSDPEETLGTVFSSDGYDEIVVVKNIEFNSLCEHHILPFSGDVHFAYIPGSKIIGLSKIPRLVRAFSRRLQVQERMTMQIADTFESVVKPRAVAVVVQGRHSCMSNRGIECQHGRMATSVVRGIFKEDARARAEAFRMMGV